jgi:hypothetical protein
MIGYLAQAIDEAIPDGATGMKAAEAVAAFLDAAGYVIVPKVQPKPHAAPIFECPECGKDVADTDTPHAPNCAWH